MPPLFCVTAQARNSREAEHVFLLNFSAQQKAVDMADARDALTGEQLERPVTLAGYGWRAARVPAAPPQAG